MTEPRLGIAYSPRGDAGIVIRGGVGLFANTFPGNITASVFGNAPNKFTPTVNYGDVALSNDAISSRMKPFRMAFQAATTSFNSNKRSAK